MAGIDAEPTCSGRVQSPGEEIANVVTHGVGALLSIAALVVMVVHASLHGDAWRVVGVAIFGSTLVALYLISALYHAIREPRTKRIFRVLDHAAIYLLIAGTYTPVTLTFLRGPWGWALFGAVWGMAVAGIVFKALQKGMGPLSTGYYVAMGWLALIAVGPLVRSTPTGLLVWLLLGGLCYTLGVVFYNLERLPYHHGLWHLFVVGGSACHFLGILYYLVPAGS